MSSIGTRRESDARRTLSIVKREGNEMTRAEFRDLFNIYKESFDEPDISDFLTKGKYYYLKVGHKVLSMMKAFLNSGIMSLWDLCTRKDFRGIGCATHLVENVIEDNLDKLIFVEVDTVELIKFYERIGFSVIGNNVDKDGNVLSYIMMFKKVLKNIK